MSDSTTIQVERKLRDRLASRGTKDMSFNEIIEELLNKTEDHEVKSHPETFDDYWQLVNYFTKIGGFVVHHKIKPDSDSVILRLRDLTIYYRLKEGKFIRCKPEEMYNPEDKTVK